METEILVLDSTAPTNKQGGETLERAAHRRGQCPIPGNIPGQAGWGSEQPAPVEDVPAHCRGIGLDDL